jgi:hypothetical protein
MSTTGNPRFVVLCRVFFIEMEGKRRTVEFCTVKTLCRAPSLRTHGKELLSCVMGGARQNKGIHSAGGVNGVNVRLPCVGLENVRQRWKLCRAPPSKTHGKVKH